MLASKNVNGISTGILTLLFVLVGVISSMAATFYSQGSGNFSNLANWDTDPGGTGTDPVLTDLTDGTNIFIIQDGHNITLDLDIDVSSLVVGQGTSGALVIGDNTTARNMIVQGVTTVNVGAAVTVGANNATHTATFLGAITNDGSIDLFNNTSQLVNSTLSGIFSISGTNTPQFGGLTFSTGTIAAAVALDIDGNLVIENGATFADGDLTHTLAGDWAENGSGQMTGNGTIQMDAPVVQSISTTSIFNNLTFNGSSTAAISANITVNGNLVVTNNTRVNTASTHTFLGDFTVDAGSEFNASAGTSIFSASTNAQTLNLNGTVAFDQLDFDNGGVANPKNVNGNITAADRTRIFDDVVINGNGDHRFEEFRMDGTCNFSGSLTFTGNNIYDNTDNVLVLGTADVIIEGGTVALAGDDNVTVNGNFTVETGIFRINANAILTGTGTGTLLIQGGRTIQMVGANNFPTGFGTVTFASITSRALYNLNGAQTIRGGISYGELELGGGGNKTVDGSIDVNGDLDLNNAVSLLLGPFDHSLAGTLANNSNSSINATGGTFTLDAPNLNQVVQNTGGSASYLFNNFAVDNIAPTGIRVKTIQANMIVNGNFSAVNTGGVGTSRPLLVDFDANVINGNFNGDFSLGADVFLLTSGTTNFQTTGLTFDTFTMDPMSTVRFDGGDQNMPGIPYGNVQLSGNGTKTAIGNMNISGNILRLAATPLFNDGGFTHTVAGNWSLRIPYTPPAFQTGTINFNGTHQVISDANFFNITFSNSGIKTINGDIVVGGDFTVDNNVTVNASTRDIDIQGNWIDTGSGIFTQTTGVTTFNGTTANQTISSSSGSSFGFLTINKTNASFETVTALTDFTVVNSFELDQDDAIFDLNGQTVFIGRDWINRTGTTFINGNGTLHFNGVIQQDLFNFNASTVYHNLVFSGVGQKDLQQNGLDIDGSVTITSTTFNAGGRACTVGGDWINNGSFQHSNRLTFDGANQAISASDFHDTFYAGTGTKTLGGNINLSGGLQIESGVTLDVGIANNNITVEEFWTNLGTFNEGTGTVTFTGGGSTITTGATGPTVGKRFYNVIVNSAGTETISGDLDVENDLTISTGTFRTNANDVFIAGSLTNSGTFQHNNNGSVITFDGTSGTHVFDPGASTDYRNIVVNASGASYTLAGDLTTNTGGGRSLTITGGAFSLGGFDITNLATNGVIQINGGSFEVDAGAVVTLGRTGAINNNGGVLRIVGNTSTPATITSNQTNTARFITITQTAGTIHGRYYLIEKTLGNGVDIQGGTIDATNNFSNGTFTNGAGTAYLTLTGLNFGAGIDLNNVIFNTGPTFNCSRTSGTGAVNFTDASGTLAGESFDNDNADPGTLINWTFPGGFFWDAGAGTTSWHDANNWTGNTIPDGTSNVVLDHTNGGVAGVYTVEINASDAIAQRVTIDAEGGNAISLVLNGQELTVNENIQVGAGTTLTQTTATDTIKVAGNWTNEGTFNEGTATVLFNGTSGSNPISTGGASDSFYNIAFDADGAVYSFQNNIDVNNDFTLEDGTLNAGSQTVTVGGNWALNGGTFNAGTSTFRFDKGGTSTQNISGGTFYNFETSNSTGSGTATKQLANSIIVERDLRIRANSVLDGGTGFHTIKRNWRNDVGLAGFTQSGVGAVIFGDTGNKNIGNGGLATAFNNLILQSNNTVTVSVDLTINGNLIITAGTNILSDGITVTGSGASNSMSQTGGTLRVQGAAPNPTNFPTGFETISLSGGLVEYRANANQDIFPTAYSNLSLRRNNTGNLQTKTATGDFTVSVDLTINDTETELDMAGFTLTLGDDINLPTGGRQIAWNGGTVIHNGAANWGIDPDLTIFNNMILTGSGDKVMNGDLTVTGNVIVQNGVRLDMNTNTMTGSGGATNFTLTAGSRLDADIPSSTGPAFPTNFGSYSLDQTSRVILRTNNDKTIYTNGGTITYGELNIAYEGSATPDGNLDVDGDFLIGNNLMVLNDGGFDFNLAGANIDIRDYTATTNTVTFDGADQTIQFLNGDTNPDVITFDNVVFTNTGAKPFTSGDDLLIIKSGFTIDAGVTMTANIDFQCAGDWTVNGTFTHTTNTGRITFDGTGPQTIDPGAAGEYDDIIFSNAGVKTLVNNTLDQNGDILTIEAGSSVNFGALSHTLAASTITVDGSWNTSNANLTFDRSGGQSIPAFSALDVNLTSGGTKTMQGAWSLNDLTIASGVTLDVNNTSNYNVTVTGNWTNNGTFTRRLGTVAFESNDTNGKTIFTNGSDFYNVTFNQAQTSIRTYTLLQNTEIDENLTIGNGATLDLNGTVLTVGDNDAGTPLGELVSVQTGGTLDVDANSTLQLDCTDDDARVIVEGTLRVVGTSGSIANLTRSNGGNRIDIDITTGTIAARFYNIRFLVNEGLDIQSGATIDPTNNLSDGAWSEINTGGGVVKRYLIIEADVTGLPDIGNVTFNHGTSPTLGVHFNVQRSAGAIGTVTFVDNIGGLLGSELYEDDGDGTKINWPPATLVTWTGATGTSDWHTAGNWSPETVPNNTIEVLIPDAGFDPIIGNADATCRNLTISDGILQVTNGFDLTVITDIVIGTGVGGFPILAVGNATSEITIGGGWTRNANALFDNGNSTVTFTAPSGAVNIQPRDSEFGNVVFNGAATFNLQGNVNIDGNVTISSGIVAPTTNNYDITVAGNIDNVGGSFSTTTNGTVTLDGAGQTVTDVSFRNLTVAGTGTKDMGGTVAVAGTLTVNSTISAAPSSTIDMNGDVLINVGGTFNDGDQSHTFSGNDWTGNGSYAGSGSVIFDRTGGTQNINGGSFNTLDLVGAAQVRLQGDVNITGDVTVRSTINTLRCQTFLINSTNGTGVFTLENESIYVSGVNNYPANFAVYDVDPNSTSFYDAFFDQTIASVTYGNLELQRATTKTLGGNIDVNGTLDINETTLDVSTSNYRINVAGDWENVDGGLFMARNGEVVFDGTTGTQDIRSGLAGTSDFHRITVNGSVLAQATNNDIQINENLRVLSGSFSLNGLTGTVGGDLTASGTGTFVTSGTYILNRAGLGSAANISMNGSTLQNLTINSGAIYTMLDDMILNGNFTLTSGEFDGNGNSVTLGNGADVVAISGVYRVGDGGTLALGNGTALTVNPTGTIYVVGSIGNVASVTRRDGGRYDFSVNGTIHANNYLFEWMDNAGIFVTSLGTIDLTDNFSNGTFTNGEGGQTLLRIENTQDLTGANRIENVAFPANPGGGAFNVTKSASTGGNVEFYNATGVFAGESFDNDPNNLIDWTGPVTLVWNGGAATPNWYDADNWTPDRVPTATDNALIPTGTPTAVIGMNGAVVNNLTIESLASLSINTPDAGVDLDISGELTINGILSMNSSNDRLEVDGNWTKGGSGTFSQGSGTVAFTNPSGLKTINNGTSPFANVEINSTGTLQISTDTEIRNNFTITAGTFDVTTGNRTVTVGGDFVNTGGAFQARNGLLVLNSTTAGTTTLNAGGSAFFDVRISAGGATTYQLTNGLSINDDLEVASGTLALNGQTATIGDGSGIDELTVAGVFDMGPNATLNMGANAGVTVSSGGVFRAVGTDAANIATITGTPSGRYSFTVASGGELEAQFYLAELMGFNGIQFNAGSLIDATNNLSNGTFSNGAPGGRYLNMLNNFTDFTVSNATFNNGPAINVRRVSGTGVVTFEDATGLLAGQDFEDDSPDGSATTGFIRWSFSNPVLTWTNTGGDQDWHNPANWDDGLGGNGVPGTLTNVFIPNTGFDPIISNNNADAGNVTINTGAVLTINTNRSLNVTGSVSNAGTLTVDAGSNTTLTVGDTWSNSGTFNNGGSSTVVLTAATGTKILTTGGSAFCGLEINSGVPGTAIFQSADAIDVDCDFTIVDGTLEITSATHTLNVAGNWNVNATGAFVNGSSTVTFDGANQSIANTSGSIFNDVVIGGTNTKTLSTGLSVGGNISISSTLSAGNNSITVLGNWANTGTFVPGTGTVAFNGATQQNLSNVSGETFFNLTINNTSGVFPQVVTNGPIAINANGTLTLTDGIIETSNFAMLTMNDNTILAGGNTPASYISGPMTKIGQDNFVFPVGKGSVFARIEITGMLTSSTFVAEYFDAGFGDYTMDPDLYSVSTVEYWDLSRPSGVGEPFVTLYWEDGARSFINDVSTLRVAHFEAGVWGDEGNGATSGNASAGSVRSSFRFTSFSPITFGSSDPANPLPVTMTSFEGELLEGEAHLTWKTASEVNNDFFEVQRSANGEDYETIGLVKGSGTTTDANTYTFVDRSPFFGANYYRLKQVDFDGGSQVEEKVVVLQLDSEGEFDVKTFPNPTTQDNINVQVVTTEEAPVSIKLVDLYGREYYNKQLEPNQLFDVINVQSNSLLRQGVYMLIVQKGSNTIKKKIMIK